MIASIFQSNRFLFAYLLGLLLTTALLAGQYFEPTLADFTAGSQPLMRLLLRAPVWLHYVLNLMSLLGGAIVFNQLMINQKVSRDYNSLFFLAYLLAAFSYGPWTQVQPALYVSFLLLLVVRNMMVAGNSRKQLSLVFDAGWLSGLAYLLYQPAWVLLPVSLLSVALGGVFRFKALLLWLFGYLTPVYLLGAWAYLRDDWSELTALFDWQNSHVLHLHFLEMADKVVLAFSMALFVLGIAVGFAGSSLKTNALRNAQRIFFILLLSGVASILLVPGDGWLMAGIFVPVGAFYIGRLLEWLQNGRLLNGLFFVWLALLIWRSGIF